MAFIQFYAVKKERKKESRRNCVTHGKKPKFLTL